RRLTIDGARLVVAAEDVGGALVEQHLAARVRPVRFGDQGAAAGASLSLDDAGVAAGAHFRRLFFRDRVGIVPEIQSVYVAVVEPQADMMRMIDALAVPRLE